MDDSGPASASTTPAVDVFGTVESPSTPKGHPVHHIREQPILDTESPLPSLFIPPTQPARASPSRAGSRRTQSVDISPRAVPALRQHAAPSPLGLTRRKRGERDVGNERKREKDALRAELDASVAVAPGLALDPRIASDVLSLERRFAAASKGKSPASSHSRTPRTHGHRPRHSLPSNRTDLLSSPHASHRVSLVEPLASLPESGSQIPESDTSAGDVGPSVPTPTAAAVTLVGPALPSSGVQTSPSSAAPSAPILSSTSPKPGPSPIRIDKSAYSSLLPSSDPEPASSGADVKRTSKAAKRTSLTAMFGMSRKRDKAKEHEKEKDKEPDPLHSPTRPGAIRADTHHTTRTTHTFLTTHTSATAGSDDHASIGSRGMSGSPMELTPAIEPSAKTLARAAATRDQLAKRYAFLYASIGGGEESSILSGSHSGSGSGEAQKQTFKPVGTNILDVVRWRSGHLTRKSAEPGVTSQNAIIQMELEGAGEGWEREIERRIRDAPLPGGDHPPVLFPDSGVPSTVQSPYAANAPLGDSLPEASSLSWLPYLEPVFAEERASVEGGVIDTGTNTDAAGVGGMSGPIAMAGAIGMGAGGVGPGPGRKRPMTAWYVLASFVESYTTAMMHRREAQQYVNKSLDALSQEPEEYPPVTPRPVPFTDPLHSHPKITSDVRAKAIVNAAYARTANGTGATSDTNTNDGPGSRFGIIDRALRTRSRQSSIGVDSGNGGISIRSRHNSVKLGVVGATSEPTSPSYPAHPGAGPRGMSAAVTSSRLTPPSKQVGEVRSTRSHSGSQIHSRSHSRSQSQARSTSAGNGQLASSGSVDWGSATRAQVGEGKSMSPASSRLNLANFIMGGAAVLGLNMRKRAQGHYGKEVISGSENESARMSSDVSPSDADGPLGVSVGFGRGGLSDGEGGRVKRRKKTWREGERVPLSDGGGSGGGSREQDLKRRSWRLSTAVLVPVEVRPDKERVARERADREKRDKEKEYARKRVVAEDTDDVLSTVDARLQSFAQLTTELNAVHHHGADIFGEMFMAVPPNIVATFTSESSECDEAMANTPLTASPLTPTQRPRFNSLPLDPLSAFVHKLEGEEKPIAVDMIGRSKLDANLPIMAFDVLHTLDHKLKELSNRIRDLRHFCDDAERERRVVKELYEDTAGSVEITYPECTQIERLLGSLVTEDMPWLPTWLPLWVRHLLEIFSNQIQFLVENGLRIYGYIYQIVSLFMFMFAVILGVMFMFARFVKSFWWVFAILGISGIGYLMTRPPEEFAALVEGEIRVGL